MGVRRWNDVSRGFRFGGLIMSVALLAAFFVSLDARIVSSLSLNALDPSIATAYQFIGKTTTNTGSEPGHSSRVTEASSKKKSVDGSKSGATSKPISAAVYALPSLKVEPLAMLTPIDTANLGDYSQLLSMSPYMDRVQAASDVKPYRQQATIVPLQASASGWKLFNVGWGWWLLYLGVSGVVARSGFLVLRQRMARQIVKNGAFEEGFL